MRQVQELRPRLRIDVRSRTRPFISPRLAADPRADGIELDVFHRQPEVTFIERAGIEPALPEVAGAAMEAVDVLRITKVRPADGLGERVFLMRRGEDMDMITHQAIAEQFEPVLVRLLFEELQIHPPIIIDEEDILAVVASLGDMMGTSGRNCSG